MHRLLLLVPMLFQVSAADVNLNCDDADKTIDGVVIELDPTLKNGSLQVWLRCKNGDDTAYSTKIQIQGYGKTKKEIFICYIVINAKFQKNPCLQPSQ